MTVIKSRAVRNFIRIAVPFAAVPLLAILGVLTFREKRHLIISFAVAILSLLLFAAGFEKRSTGTRRMVMTSVMIALSFAGRFIPLLKPVAALVIISGVYLGGEAGFLVGAMTAILTNFYFGQGPWTALQMLAWGLTGLAAGILAEPLKRSRMCLLAYGVISGIAYSLIMEIWTVLWYGEGFRSDLYLAAVTSAVPFTISYAAANVLFLYLLFKPFSEKLERIKVKYGI